MKILLILTVAGFVFQQTGDLFFGTSLLQALSLVPSDFLRGAAWQIFTFPFIHSNVLHLFFDGLVLAFIGSELEFLWGRPRFLKYALFCAWSSALVYLLTPLFSGGPVYTPMLGLSGVIYGILVAYGLLFGERVLLFMMIFPMKAKHFVWLIALFELLTTAYSTGGKWASLAHLAAMVSGILYLWGQAVFLRRKRLGQQPSRLKSKKSKRRSSHLRLISSDEDFDSNDSNSNSQTWH